MALRHLIPNNRFAIPNYLQKTKPYNARTVIHTTPAALVSLDQPPANRYSSVTTATNRSIILNAIKSLHSYVIYSFYD